ncbi:MAG TPA: flavodoxin family protein [Methanothermobacter sp.]|nr:flavodoxin family protein [Methanothermobacter sp.]
MGIVGSPRKKGNTNYLVKEALKAAGKLGVETELINIGDVEIEPCVACDICKSTGECAIYDDVPNLLGKLADSQGVIFGSPVYFGSMTSQLKMLIDRSRPLRFDFKLKNKVGGGISVGGSRNGGQETTISAIHQFMLIHDMIIVGDGAPLAHYGGTGVGSNINSAEGDDVGLETSRNLGRRMAELILEISNK